MAKIAVIETGGKQYVVSDGDVVTIDPIRKPSASNGAGKVVFDKVLLVDDGAAVKVGAPTVSGAKVTGELVSEGRAAKVTVIRYRQKSRYFKKKGHRQAFSKVKILSV